MAEADVLFEAAAAKLRGDGGARDLAGARELFRQAAGEGRVDAAVVYANLLAAGVGGWLIDRKIAYVTSEESFRTPFARSYRVLEHLPYREKPLRAALRARGIGTLTIKKRGVDVSPEQLRKRLALHGEDEATLVLTRARGEGVALLVKPF